MDIKSIANSNTVFKFWRTDGTSLDVNILLMCKLMFLLLLTNYFPSYLDGPFIPFIEALDILRPYSLTIKIGLQFGFLLSGIALLLNFRVRVASLVLGLLIVFALLCSKPLFRNHLFICGCVFLLSAFTKKGRTPWLLIIQLSLVYLGALLNKFLQVDWWTGDFMHNWLANARANEMYIWASNLLPDLWMAKMISWSSMVVECTIGVLLLIKRKHYLAVWLILLFHTLLYSVTLFRFGHFFEDIVIFLLVFAEIPKANITIHYHPIKWKTMTVLLKYLNLNRQFNWEKSTAMKNHWLQLTVGEQSVSNFMALRYILLYSTGFYVLLFVLDQGIRFITEGDVWHIIMVTLSWLFILFFSPLIFKRKLLIKPNNN